MTEKVVAELKSDNVCSLSTVNNCAYFFIPSWAYLPFPLVIIETDPPLCFSGRNSQA